MKALSHEDIRIKAYLMHEREAEERRRGNVAKLGAFIIIGMPGLLLNDFFILKLEPVSGYVSICFDSKLVYS